MTAKYCGACSTVLTSNRCVCGWIDISVGADKREIKCFMDGCNRFGWLSVGMGRVVCDDCHAKVLERNGHERWSDKLVREKKESPKHIAFMKKFRTLDTKQKSAAVARIFSKMKTIGVIEK